MAIVAAAGWVAWLRPARVEVDGASMRPELEPGDWAVAVRARRFRVGDVVVAEHPHRPGFEVVKRVLAGPGDVAPGGRRLEAAEWWLEGDAADASTDSRSFGPVRTRALLGRVVAVYGPAERRRLVRRSG